MITRRDFLQVAAAVAALHRLGAAWAAPRPQQAHSPGGLAAVCRQGPAHAPAHGRRPRAAQTSLLSRALAQPRRRARPRASSPTSPARSSRRLRHSDPLAGSLHADARPISRRWPGPMGGSAAWTAWRRSFTPSAPSAAADRVLLLDGGDALQGSYTALESKGADMVCGAAGARVDAITGHWEFTLGEHRINEIFGTLERQGLLGPRPSGRQCARHRLRRAGVSCPAHVREGRDQASP